MNQEDWIGSPEPRPFKDIRNQRDSVASQKATLLLRLGELINRIPQNIRDGG